MRKRCMLRQDFHGWRVTWTDRKSSFKLPRGGLVISSSFEGGGGLFNLETTMISVLHKKLEYKVEKLK